MRYKRVIVILFATLLAVFGCRKRAPIAIAVPLPEAAIIAEPEPLPPLPVPTITVPDPVPIAPEPPPPTPAEVALEAGNLAFETGAFIDAADAYREYLALVPSDGGRAEALLRLGLIAARAVPTDWTQAANYLTQLTLEFPDSPLKTTAALILSLHSEIESLSSESQRREDRIKQLSAELDRLKRIDADRRRRP